MRNFAESRSVEGRTALITGAGSGIGAATAEVFIEAMANVVVSDVDGIRAQEVARRLDPTGERVIGLELNVALPDQIRHCVKSAAEKFGGIDIVVNNAGFNAIQPFETDGFETTWQHALDVMLSGPKSVFRAALPHLKESTCARVVNISSIEALASAKHSSAYGAAKAGLLGLTRALAVEYGPAGITVNCVCPGPILTDMTSPVPEELREKYVARYTALHRHGLPEEVAHMVLSLCLPAAAFVTGSIVTVDGGLTARSS